MLYVLFGIYYNVFKPNRWPHIRSRWYGRHAAWIWLLIMVVFWIIGLLSPESQSRMDVATLPWQVFLVEKIPGGSNYITKTIHIRIMQ